jgi:hypothetical protein
MLPAVQNDIINALELHGNRQCQTSVHFRCGCTITYVLSMVVAGIL